MQVLDLLNETGMINFKPAKTTLIPNKKNSANMECNYVDATSYIRLWLGN